MNKIIILTIAFAALTGVGILGNMIVLNIQPLGIFASLDELPGSICTCEGEDGTFSPLFCEQFAGIYSDSSEMKCEKIAPNGILSYGDPPLAAGGCSVDFWKSHADAEKYPSVWTTGYSPDYYFNDMFQVNIKLPDEVDDEKENDVENVRDETVEGIPSIETAEKETVEQEEDSTETDEVEIDAFGNVIISEPETVEQEVEERLETVEQEENSTETDEEKRDIFGNIIPERRKDLNLLQALELEGSQLNQLVRESVAAMLNSAHPEIDYTYSVAKIISMTQIAMANGDYDNTITLLKEINDIGNTPICRT